MFCTRCGTANADNAQFCVKCGAAFPAAPGAAPGPAAPPATTPSGWPAPPVGASSYPASAQPYQGPVESSGKALGSLICGILFFFFPFAIVAIVLGHLALSDIRRAAGRLTGQGMAIAGLVLGYAGIAFIPIILIVAAIAIPNLLRARMAAYEASAVESLREINVANLQYETTYGNGFAASLEALGGEIGDEPSCDHALMIPRALTVGQKSGYIFTYTAVAGPSESSSAQSPTVAAKGCAAPGGAGYTVVADPLERGTTGQRSFYTDQTGTIRYDSNGEATADSTPVE